MSKVVGNLILLGYDKDSEQEDHISIPFEIEVSKNVVGFVKEYPIDNVIWYIKNLKLIENE